MKKDAPKKKAPAKARAKGAAKPDENQLAQHLIKRVTAQAGPAAVQGPPLQSEISRVMAELGRRGGKIGGKRRMTTLTQEQRSQIAYKAAQARWAKKP